VSLSLGSDIVELGKRVEESIRTELNRYKYNSAVGLYLEVTKRPHGSEVD
jgi:hypothetical protein